MAELWDLYDEERHPLGITVERGKHNGSRAWHIVVFAFVRNSRGEILLTLRDPRKPYFGGQWEITGGSVLAGETSEQGVLRELKEETGIDHTHSKRTFLGTYHTYWDDGELGWHGDLDDVWLFEADFPLSDVTVQEGETVDARWATEDEIRGLVAEGMFANTKFLPFLFGNKE